MKRIQLAFALLVFALPLAAQTNDTARLALVSESGDAGPVSDILTASLSGNPKIHLLERNEIERVYREQGLSAANKDYLKLGQILGADGLLLMETAKAGTNQSLNVRLVAVKPGVVLAAEKFSWPIQDLRVWSAEYARHLDFFLPKLTVLVKDAIPISVVNLRSATSSAEALESERQLKVLAIQWLSQEPRLFVLERQRMQLLAAEKELKLDDTAFWNGSYLLEGVVDQNGYSKDTITINARLTPPKGGAPLLIAASGSRTNFAEVINQLAAQVNQLLKISSSVREWNAADESAQYFAEAKWAFQWGVLPEAQAAADSAWALGKRDLECATLRLQSCLFELPRYFIPVQSSEGSFSSGYDANGKPLGPPPSDAQVQAWISNRMAEFSFWRAYSLLNMEGSGGRTAHFFFATRTADPKDIDRSLRALEIYYEFCRTSSQGEPKPGSDWYRLGLKSLASASTVLQLFWLAPEERMPVADKLADLRAMARSVAEVIFQSPSVHKTYFVGDHVPSPAELARDFPASQLPELPHTGNIFDLSLSWGCFWQERPEDIITLYRELMSSPLFVCIHSDFWFRDPSHPRLIAWNTEDEKRIPEVGNAFMAELSSSTNYLHRLEAKAIPCANAVSEIWATNTDMGTILRLKDRLSGKDKAVKASLDELFGFISTNYEAIIASNKALESLDWGVNSFFDKKSEYATRFAALMGEIRDRVKAKENESILVEQERFLKDNKPFDRGAFEQMFSESRRHYTRAQILEIEPLLAQYRTNLVKPAPPGADMSVWSVQENIHHMIDPSAPWFQGPATAAAANAAATTKPVAAAAAPAHVPEIVTNAIVVSKFLAIPLDGLKDNTSSSVSVFSHHWMEQKLLLDLTYPAAVYSFDEKGNWKETRMTTMCGIAILDPETGHWDVTRSSEVNTFPMLPNNFYHPSVLWHGDLFTNPKGQISKFNSKTKKWEILPVSDGGDYALFVVNDHLYAANGLAVIEITDGGKGTRILASARRQPPVSALDRQDFQLPVLFEGPGHSLRIATRNKIYTWVDNDWREDPVVLPSPFQAEICASGVLFRNRSPGMFQPQPQPGSLSLLMTEAMSPELCFANSPKPANANPANASRRGAASVPSPQPLWEMPPGSNFANLPAALGPSNLYLWLDHSEVQPVVDKDHVIVGEKVVGKDGYNAALLCFSRGLPSPQKVLLKFDSSAGTPPVKPMWMLSSPKFLFFGHDSVGGKPGVWTLPISQLESAIAAQQKAQLAANARTAAAADQVRMIPVTNAGGNFYGPPANLRTARGGIGSSNRTTNNRTP
jgi:hypothetical protein